MRLNKDKILIIGPIGEFGGRELETGFIASVFAKKYEVKVISTAHYFEKSQVMSFGVIDYTSLTKEIFQKSFFIRCILKLLSLLHSNVIVSPKSLSIPFVKKLLKIERLKAKYLQKELPNYDLIFVCAQVYSNYLEEIIGAAYKHKIPVVFRTTGTINNDIVALNYSWLSKVSLFIHHSKKNAVQLAKICNINFTVIDQCAYAESDLLKIKVKDSISRFFTLSRLSAEKQVHNVINAFNKVCAESDFLYIFGDGLERKKLESLAKGNSRIEFKGQIACNEVINAFKENDCFIISSSEEAGPLTGIEAMASGKILISTRVGAMNERLPAYKFWYDGSQKGLEEQLKLVKTLNNTEAIELSRQLRARYRDKYSIKQVSEDYMNSIAMFLKR